MAPAIEEVSGKRIGHMGLGMHGNSPGSVAQQVHDGDTVSVRALGNLGVRFLGVDAPEMSFPLPGERQFTALSNDRWEDFLADPLSGDIELSSGLRNYLQQRVGAGAATNHRRHAEVATVELERQIKNDIEAQGLTKDNFAFYLRFATEIVDRYGRLLCYLNCDEPDETKRPPTYNERQLQAGLVSPYFIWPNLDPFKRQPSLLDAVFAPGTANIVGHTGALRDARDAVRAARDQHIGLYELADPLRLQPFEVRYLAQRRTPDRWVIDLSKSGDILIKPTDYFTIPNVEDRLFIPKEYVPLFEDKGWLRQP